MSENPVMNISDHTQFNTYECMYICCPTNSIVNPAVNISYKTAVNLGTYVHMHVLYSTHKTQYTIKQTPPHVSNNWITGGKNFL